MPGRCQNFASGIFGQLGSFLSENVQFHVIFFIIIKQKYEPPNSQICLHTIEIHYCPRLTSWLLHLKLMT